MPFRSYCRTPRLTSAAPGVKINCRAKKVSDGRQIDAHCRGNGEHQVMGDRDKTCGPHITVRENDGYTWIPGGAYHKENDGNQVDAHKENGGH